jgi:hypothetical protein
MTTRKCRSGLLSMLEAGYVNQTEYGSDIAGGETHAL